MLLITSLVYKIRFWVRSLLRTALVQHTKQSYYEAHVGKVWEFKVKLRGNVYNDDIKRMIILHALAS